MTCDTTHITQRGDSARETDEAFLSCLLDIGEAMLFAGGDVNLVERSICRMGAAHGAVDMNVFAITSFMVATMTMPDGSEVTQARRIDSTGCTNFDQVEKLDKLCTAVCENRLGAEETRARFGAIVKQPFPPSALYLGGIISAGSFAVFFGGSALDGVVSALVAILVCLFMDKLKRFSPNNIVFNFATALVSGLLIGAVAHLVPGVSTDMVIIGDIMLLIPGVAMTNAARDMLAGETVTGVMRFVESLLWATALASGFMVAMWATDAGSLIISHPRTPVEDAAIELVMAAFAALGFGLLFNLRASLIPAACVGGVLSWGIYLAGGVFVEGIFIPCLIASAFSALYAEALARRYHAPTAIFFIIIMIPLIPGRGLYLTMENVVRGDWPMTCEFAMLTLQFAAGIALGLAAVWAVTEIMRKVGAHRAAQS